MERADEAGGLTGRAWLERLFTAWRARYPWFTAKPVPTLKLETPGGAYEPKLEALNVPQDPGSLQSMRAIVDDVLNIFVGYTLRVDADNDVVLVPPYWHEAALPPLELGAFDLVSLPRPEVDALSIINRATVRSQAWKFVGDQEVAPPAYLTKHSQSQNILTELLTTGNALLGATYVPTQDLPEGMEVGYVLTFVTPAGESVDVTIAETAYFNNNGISVEPLSAPLPDRSKADFTPRDREEVGGSLWRFGTAEEGVLVGGDELKLHIRLRMYESDRVIRPSGYWDLTLQSDQTETVKLERQKTKVVERTHAQGPDMVFRVALTWAERGVDVNVLYFSTGAPAEDSRYAYRLDLNAFGAKWGRSPKTVSATWGEEEQLSEVPGVAQSRDTYGEIAVTLESSVFPLDAGVCLDVARSLVTANKDPVSRFTLEQSTWNAFPVHPGRIATRVTLHTGEAGVVEGVSYGDGFAYNDASVTSTFDLLVTDYFIPPSAVGAFLQDETGAYLLDESGAYLEMEG